MCLVFCQHTTRLDKHFSIPTRLIYIVLASQILLNGPSQLVNTATQCLKSLFFFQAFLVITSPQNADGRTTLCIHCRPSIGRCISNIDDLGWMDVHFLAALQYAIAERFGTWDRIGAVDGGKSLINSIAFRIGRR
mmetsp:Transcript_3690/g.9370  ORF Transcript_3690/g.9370 Transcript_3690/m.9370 type:complete len:135 (+) Transcript_3690:223-627(+)